MTSSTDHRVARRSLHDLIANVRRAAVAYERPDLVRSLDRLDRSLRLGRSRIVVAGDFKRGKSALVNALVNATVCSTDVARTTNRPTVIRHGAETTITAVRVDDHGRERSESIDAAALAGLQDGDDSSVERLEITLDRRLLADGLEIVDCPAAAGHGDPGRAATLAAATEADAVLFVTDASQELTAHEMDLVTALAERCATVAVVTTRIDLSHRWRMIAERDTATLRRHGLSVPNIPVSTAVRVAALELGNRELNEESGFHNLIDAIRERVLDRADDVAALRTGQVVRRAVADLEENLQREAHRLDDPAAVAEAAQVVEKAKTRAEALRGQNSRWQRVLNEGAADLQTEVEHQFQESLRTVLDDAQERIDDMNPNKDWETFEPWLRDTLATLVDEVVVNTHEGLGRVADDAAQAFAEAEVEITGAMSGFGPELLSELDVREKMQRSRVAVLGDGLAAIRGSYSGLLMFGMLGGMFGFALLNPVTIALGIGLGGKAVHDERTRLLASRRNQAQTAVRDYVDQVSTRTRKEIRAQIRNEQRAMRDLLSGQADELLRAADAALVRARQDAQSDTTQRSRRRNDVAAEVRRVRELKTRVDTVLGEDGTGA